MDGTRTAIIDIGSNSVRLVVYEMLARAPAQVFNEKEMAGLGRQVGDAGHRAVVGLQPLNADAVL